MSHYCRHSVNHWYYIASFSPPRAKGFCILQRYVMVQLTWHCLGTQAVPILSHWASNQSHQASRPPQGRGPSGLCGQWLAGGHRHTSEMPCWRPGSQHGQAWRGQATCQVWVGLIASTHPPGLAQLKGSAPLDLEPLGAEELVGEMRPQLGTGSAHRGPLPFQASLVHSLSLFQGTSCVPGPGWMLRTCCITDSSLTCKI